MDETFTYPPIQARTAFPPLHTRVVTATVNNWLSMVGMLVNPFTAGARGLFNKTTKKVYPQAKKWPVVITGHQKSSINRVVG
ncbi:hypothetical protein [Vreelandella arcis]|uniref:hypothetical protein n=1 Tax=Vreelandella arcis TaxID=416873 RepID=UPI00111457EE|nr:hypothetical protein [Halomonas arcis]